MPAGPEASAETPGTLRVLACYRAEAFIGPQAATDLKELGEIGWLPGVRASRALATIDPITNPAARPDGESEHGIAVHQHPEAMLRDAPELWGIVDLWNAGVDRALSRADFALMSDFEVTCWGALRAAHAREQTRWLEDQTPRGDRDEQGGG